MVASLGKPVADLACKDPLLHETSKVLLLDGGFATHIEALGMDIDHSLWSSICLMKDPDLIQKAHADFYAAGARVAITASYQAHLEGFKELGLGAKEAADYVKLSVELARKVAPTGGLVAGSVGSYGASLHNGAEYTGDFPGMDEAALIEFHRPRIMALIEAECDILACETIPCLIEARALTMLLREVKFPAWVTFSCRSESEVCSGESLQDCIALVGACEYVVGAGVNCTNPSYISDLVTICRATLPSNKHVVVYPNSGEEWCGESHTWKSGTAASDTAFVNMAREWIARGADCVGGCCRTTPATIKVLKDVFGEAA